MVKSPTQRAYSTLLLLAIVMSVSFRSGYIEPGRVAQWNLTPAEPVLWLRFCEDDILYIDEEPTGDGSGETTLVISNSQRLKATALAAINSIDTSFLRVALHPEDPDAAFVTTPYDDSYSEAKAAMRTIDICTTPSDPTLAGYASTLSGSTSPLCSGEDPDVTYEDYCRHEWLYACNITMVTKSLPTARSFTHTLLHEMMHCFGVLHNHETNQSIMSYTTDEQTTFTPSMDDKMALTKLYPLKPSFGREQPTLGMGCETAKP